MRSVPLFLVLGTLVGVEPEPAPATITGTTGSGPSAGARATDSALAADMAWAAARRNAELQAQARAAAAAKATAHAIDLRGPLVEPAPVSAGPLNLLSAVDEVALLIELQRRRHAAAGNPGSDLVAAELASLSASPPHLPSIALTPGESSNVAHPEDESHPGPGVPLSVDAPARPEHFPSR
jgi:hypothetical protein